ncbi:MAG: hypothetical protein AAB941_00520 [Patescibacteria group bacterium]
MPILYYVPIIHSVEDYGSLGPAIKKSFARQAGEDFFAHLQKNIKEYWQIVEERIEKMISDVAGFIIYHDGFPVGDRKKVLALFGFMCQDHPESANFRLIKKLVAKGAVLEGTEDISLVVEHLQLYQRAAEAATTEEQKKILASQATRSLEIMRLRDKFIARRINDTLPESGKGILFIGRDHDVITELEKLPRKFTVIYL